MPDVIPWGEWRPDISPYKGGHSVEITNAYPRGDGYGPVKDFASLTSALPASCRGFFIAYAKDGTIKIFAGTDDRLYVLDNTDYTWDDASNGGSAYTGLTNAAQWQFEQFGDLVIAVQGNVSPQKFDITSDTQFSNLGGSPPQAAYVAVVNQFVVLSGLTNDEFKIKWSGRSNAEQWTATVNESGEQEYSDGGIIRGVAGGEFGLVFQDRVIRQMIYQPGDPLVFSFDRIAEDMGLAYPYSLVKARDYIFFISQTGFQQWSPTMGFKPIGREKWDRTFLMDADLDQPQLIIGAPDPQATRILWAYKSVQGTAGLFDRVIAYDWTLERAAGYVDLAGEYIASAAVPGTTLESLTTPASIDDFSASLDDFPTSFQTTLAMFDSTNALGLLSGASKEATLVTPSIVNDTRVYIRGHRPITDCDCVLGSVGGAQRTMDPLTYGTEYAVNRVGIVPHTRDTRIVRFKNRFPAGADWEYSIGVEPDMVGTGKQ